MLPFKFQKLGGRGEFLRSGTFYASPSGYVLMDLRHWNGKYQVQRSKKQDMRCHDIFKYTLFNLCILLKSNF